MTHVDDEYSQAGIEDPRVLITTSRDPSSKLAQFAKVRINLVSHKLPANANHFEGNALVRSKLDSYQSR